MADDSAQVNSTFVSDNSTTSVPVPLSTFSPDAIANITLTIFFLFFLCCIGYALYYCQDARDRLDRTRTALGRNKAIDEHLRHNRIPTLPAEGEMQESSAQPQSTPSNPPPSAVPQYNAAISISLSPPEFSPHVDSDRSGSSKAEEAADDINSNNSLQNFSKSD